MSAALTFQVFLFLLWFSNDCPEFASLEERPTIALTVLQVIKNFVYTESCNWCFIKARYKYRNRNHPASGERSGSGLSAWAVSLKGM